ncbi:MAG: type II secretion system protein, partial [bacterium]|nr:type II secretion system protein [bacterium]
MKNQVSGVRCQVSGRKSTHFVFPWNLEPGTSNLHQRGFTLVEMIVAVGLFAVVMVVSVGALLSL